jgi:S-adenosylmethionine decarboxylase
MVYACLHICFTHRLALAFCIDTVTFSAAAAKLQCTPSFVAFSRANYRFPEVQPDVHRDFDSEVSYLQQHFPMGSAYVLGPSHGPRWHIFLANVAATPSESREQTFEVVMTNLDASAMQPFYRRKDDPHAKIYNAPAVTMLTGIDLLLPGSTIDGFLFEPCGYSCNGIRGADYFTIHITPEPHCSFVSFETNATLGSYDSLLQHVLAIFRPGTFSVSVFVDNASPLSDAQRAIDWECMGYARDDCCVLDFPSGCNLAYGNFVSSASAVCKPTSVSSPLRLPCDSKVADDFEYEDECKRHVHGFKDCS